MNANIALNGFAGNFEEIVLPIITRGIDPTNKFKAVDNRHFQYPHA